MKSIRAFRNVLLCVKLNFILFNCLLSFLPACKTVPVKREIKAVQEISSISPTQKFVKTHMKDGKVYILHHWVYDSARYVMAGYGSLLDINRNVMETRGGEKRTKDEPFTIPLTEVALLETNDPGPSIAGGLGIVTGITAGFTIFCIANPKACFGSCPTFYADNGDTLALQAEGFSTSISPSLEKNDIDMLYSARYKKDFALVVTNEALETHSIRFAHILAFEKQGTERVFVSADGSFYKCNNVYQPTSCKSDSGDCMNKIQSVDGDEYYSMADADNLNSKEEIIVSFNTEQAQELGLVIGKRQTLLTTFLMYQGLAYMGNSAAYWLAEMERGKIARRETVFDLLGGIEVFAKDENGNWQPEGKLHETGPIATDFNIVPLASKHLGRVDLKLRLNKGLWRIDYLGLATISGKVSPTVIQPYAVETIKGMESNPLGKLTREQEYLVTYPGDSYKIKYQLPYNNAELFLDSRGYYLEWIRTEWMNEQNFRKLHLMVNKPSLYLKRAARPYKKIEPTMEKTFWNSRYVQK
ncbi:hypothetical protein OCK74_11015 [Chitinophagaceae bacterium LB-8]|uniref:Uncharacterized protein n=1 Tax=Paraflavisolibacter caeni TaxID=2982496 RepID=A0A9X2XXT0_9BACT|nr:hypothetical protein [Paraflavisolibacter caeni]MCU7549648.1 hypothetical protein [Paraflavisolibacter caeni]